MGGNGRGGAMSETRELVRLANEDGTILTWQQVESLGRVCEVLLAAHPDAPCLNDEIPAELSCPVVWPTTQDLWCQPCRDRAIRERCDRAARGEK